MLLNLLRLQARSSWCTQPKLVQHFLLRPRGQRACGKLCPVSYAHEELALLILQGVPHSHHTHTHTHTHMRARSGGLILFNRRGKLCAAWGRLKKKKRRIRVAAFMFCCPLILLPGPSTTPGLVPHKWDLSFRRTQWWLMYPTHQSQSFTIALFSRCFYIY